MKEDSPNATPATEKQIALLQSLGVSCPPECTLAQAAELIGLVRIIFTFAERIAEQEWRQSLEGRDLSPLVNVILSKPGMCEQISDAMDASAQAAWTAKNDEDETKIYTRHSSRRELTPDLREDACYLFVKMKLQKLFPDLKPYVPVITPLPSMRVFLAKEEPFKNRMIEWVNELFGR